MILFGLGRNVQPFSSSLRRVLQEMYSIFLRECELILISSDVTAHARAFCGTRSSTYYPVLFRKSRPSCHFRTLTAYNKEMKINFQKLMSKPFSNMAKSVKLT